MVIYEAEVLGMNEENAIEFYTGDDYMTVSFTRTKFVNKIRKLAEKHPDEVRIEAINQDGSICATLPLSYLKISHPRVVSEEQREVARENMLKFIERG